MVARHELRSLLGAAQPDRRFAAINGDFPIELSDSRIIITQADLKSCRGGRPRGLIEPIPAPIWFTHDVTELLPPFPPIFPLELSLPSDVTGYEIIRL